MEDVIYRLYKNNVLIHQGSCPSVFFTSVIPMNDQELFDYMEIEWNGYKKIYNKEKKQPSWKP